MDSGTQTSNILFSKKRSKAFLDLAKKETREDSTLAIEIKAFTFVTTLYLHVCITELICMWLLR